MPTASKVRNVKVARPDERIRREAKEIDGEFQKLKTDFRPPQVARPDVGEEGLGHRFPAKLVAIDPDDERLEMKLQAPRELGLKMLEKEDLKNLQRKKQNLQWAEFENWCETYFDMKDPAIQRLVEEMMPEYFERREQQIDEVADLQKQIALLLLYGPRSKSDLLLEYAIRNGKLNVPKGAIWDPASWYTSDQTAFNNMARGMFNPRRYAAAPSRPAMGDRWDIGTPRPSGIASPFFAYNRSSTVDVGGDIAGSAGAPRPPF